MQTLFITASPVLSAHSRSSWLLTGRRSAAKAGGAVALSRAWRGLGLASEDAPVLSGWAARSQASLRSLRLLDRAG